MNLEESLGAAKFWTLVVLGIFLCVYFGRLATQTAPSVLAGLLLLMAASLLTVYSPKIGLGILAFSMLLSPEVSLGGFSSAPGDPSRSVVVRMDDFLLIVVFLSWLGRTAVLKGMPFLAGTPVHLPVMLYTICCVLSTALGILRGEVSPLKSSLYVLKYVEYFLLFFMTANIAEDWEDVRRYLWCFMLTALIVVVYGYVTYFAMGHGYRTSAPFEAPFGEERYSEPANLGGYLLVVLGMLLGLYTQMDAPASLLALAALFVFLPDFILTLSRASYAGLVATLMSVLLLTRKKRLHLLFSIGAVGFILLVAFPVLKESVLNRVMFTFTGRGSRSVFSRELRQVAIGAGSIGLEPSAAQRVLSWRRVLAEDFPRHPVLGSGVTGVGLVDAQYPLILGEVGLLGLCLFVWMIWRIARVSWMLFSAQQAPPLERSLGLGLLAGLAGLLVQGLTTNTFIIVRIMEPFWFLAAMAAAMCVRRAALRELPA